jgi:hypothetical protein
VKTDLPFKQVVSVDGISSPAPLVGVLSLTLIGCSGPTARRAMPITAADPPFKVKSTALKSDRARAKVASKNATKAVEVSSVAAKSAKQPVPQPSKGFDKNKIAAAIMMDPEASASRSSQPAESATSVLRMNMVATSGQTAETSDPVLEKAKAMVAAKMGNPASVEFEDMARAIRRDPYGQSIDTICGYVRGKKTSGAETGKRAFLYLVKDGIALVDHGPISLAATAYRNVCTSAGLKSDIGP